MLVCSSDFPHLDRTMNIGGQPGTGPAITATQTSHRDVTRPSRLDVGVLP
jgi:hypothetical protein